MRTEHARIEPNTTYPIAEETGILSGREALLGPTLCGKKVLSRLPVHHTQVIINRLPGLFGDLEPYPVGRSSPYSGHRRANRRLILTGQSGYALPAKYRPLHRVSGARRVRSWRYSCRASSEAARQSLTRRRHGSMASEQLRMDEKASLKGGIV